MNHRLSGYLYNGLTKEQRLIMPKELRKSFEMLVLGQSFRQETLNKYITELDETLKKGKVRFAGLKGIIYGASLYQKGTRRSNDLDLLVYEEDLSELDCLLRSVGYIQSNMPDGKLVEASKKEKLIQRMNYHDLVPYVKAIDDDYISIDINFLFDGKDNLIDEKVFKRGTRIYEGAQYKFIGLEFDTNLAFLIAHFYREATGKLWLNNKRNLILYKIVDIVNYIRQYEKEINIEDFLELLDELNLIEKTLYTFLTINKFYKELEFVNRCIEKISIKYSDIYQKFINDSIFGQYYEDSFNLGR